jgi:hypothetical protein
MIVGFDGFTVLNGTEEELAKFFTDIPRFLVEYRASLAYEYFASASF